MGLALCHSKLTFINNHIITLKTYGNLKFKVILILQLTYYAFKLKEYLYMRFIEINNEIYLLYVLSLQATQITFLLSTQTKIYSIIKSENPNEWLVTMQFVNPKKLRN